MLVAQTVWNAELENPVTRLVVGQNLWCSRGTGSVEVSR